jgi:flavin reductase (DIM6/NTAB) family NADH-FMN oxidoreductase RutF
VFSEFIAHLDYPMVVVTTVSEEARAGCLVGFHSQCSIEPERFAIWVSKANFSFGVVLRAEIFAVHALDESAREIATLFGTQTGDEIDKFEHCRWHPGPRGVPLLDDCPNRVVALRTGLFDDGGDHLCVVVRPIHAEVGASFTPLRFQGVRTLQAGHDAREPRGR